MACKKEEFKSLTKTSGLTFSTTAADHHQFSPSTSQRYRASKQPTPPRPASSGRSSTPAQVKWSLSRPLFRPMRRACTNFSRHQQPFVYRDDRTDASPPGHGRHLPTGGDRSFTSLRCEWRRGQMLWKGESRSDATVLHAAVFINAPNSTLAEWEYNCSSQTIEQWEQAAPCQQSGRVLRPFGATGTAADLRVPVEFVASHQWHYTSTAGHLLVSFGGTSMTSTTATSSSSQHAAAARNPVWSAELVLLLHPQT